jgi:uncharacterized protein (DUF1697 family)
VTPKPTPSRSSALPIHVALLRGINVGGKNKLPMAELVQLFTAAGCAQVQTYIQSGNVVFAASPATAQRVPAKVSAAIAARLGLRVPIVLRRADELRAVVARNPLLKAGADQGTLHVAFLEHEPDRRAITALDPKRSPGDAFAVVGREVYLHLPSGVARTKLTNAYFDSKLATTSTLRNWRTVLKLVELTGAQP